MQKKSHALVFALLTASLLAAPLAEAKRAGGGKSHGMSRSAPSQNYQQQRPTQPMQQQTPTQPQRSGSNVGGMVAAGVAGAAIGAVAANAMADDGQQRQADPSQQANQHNAEATENKSGGMGWLWMILIIGGAFFLFRKLAAKKLAVGNTSSHNPYAPNSSGATRRQTAPVTHSSPSAGGNTNIFGQSIGGGSNTAPQTAPFGSATMSSGNALPDGTEPANFLRFARQRFNHIQSMNNASNINEIQKYFTPEMYQAMYSEITNNADVAEFSNLTANVVDQSTEDGQYVVSVRFTGTVSEDLNALPQPFTEIWHFVKPIGSSDEWLVAGIQQV